MENEQIIIKGYMRLSVILSALQKNLERVKTDRVQSLNLKNSEVFLVYMLHDNSDGLTAEQLSHACNLDRSLISRNLQSLKEKGMIVCPSAIEGKRSYASKLYLTEKGKQVGDAICDYEKVIQAYLNEGISRADLEIMYATLEKLRVRFEEVNRLTREKQTDRLRIPPADLGEK